MWERLVGQLWLFVGALDSATVHFTRALADTTIDGDWHRVVARDDRRA